MGGFWVSMSPAQFLILVILAAAGAVALQVGRDAYRRRALRALAREWRMQFSCHDRLKLGDRIAGKVPVPGAARVTVRNLLFCIEASQHEYLFTVEYCVGAVRGKRHRSRVGGFREPVARGGGGVCADCTLTLAPAEMDLAGQYRYVHDALAGAASGR
jgi:hypothetical protein